MSLDGSIHVTIKSRSNFLDAREREKEKMGESRIEKDKGAQLICLLHLILLACIAGNSSLEPLLEGLFAVAQIHIDLS